MQSSTIFSNNQVFKQKNYDLWPKAFSDGHPVVALKLNYTTFSL